MTRRFRDDATTEAERRAAKLLELAAVAPRELDRAGWDDVVAAALRPRRDWRWRLPVLVASLLALGGVLVLARSPSTSPTLVVTNATQWARAESGVVSLQGGRLTVPKGSAAPVSIETPDATIAAVGAAFLAEVVNGQTVVVVEEGEVVVRAGQVDHTVHAGETFRWPERTAPTGCRGPGPAQLACLEVEARGDSLDAQAALYELGALRAREGDVDGALSTWTASLTRFPDGVLTPELLLAKIGALRSAGRVDEARVVAREFERCCAEDPRIDDVRRLLAP